jgi:hypothetical protein
MSPGDIVEKARRCGVSLTLDPAGTGLSLWADDDPPEEVVELLKAHKPAIVAHLQVERGRINHWIADQLIDWPPESQRWKYRRGIGYDDPKPSPGHGRL